MCLQGTITSLVFFGLCRVVEEHTGMGVGVDGFFCEARGYIAGRLFPRSLAETGSDAAFRSNNLKLTFAIAKLFS